MNKRPYGWEIAHDCGHHYLGGLPVLTIEKPAAQPQQKKIEIFPSADGTYMSHNMASDDEVFAHLNQMLEAWKARRN